MPPIRNAPLTATELAVLAAAARGLTVEETARELRRAHETVKSHRRRYLLKLGARNSAHAVALACEQGLLGKIPPPPSALSEGQLRAIYAKSTSVDNALAQPRGTAKGDALERASGNFGHEIGHVNDLTTIEASWVLDHLEAQQSQAVCAS